MQLDGFLDTLLGPLINIILLLMKIVINALAKIALIPWRLTAEDAADAGILKTILSSRTINRIDKFKQRNGRCQ